MYDKATSQFDLRSSQSGYPSPNPLNQPSVDDNGGFMKFHRTINEAFPKTMEYGASIEKPRFTRAEKVLSIVYALAGLVILFDLLFWRP